MKKIVWLFFTVACMCFIMATSLFSKEVSAASSGQTGYCSWSLDSTGTTLTIKKNDTMSGMMGPSLCDSIGSQSSKIQTVIIESGVTSIGDSAFKNCKNITKVVIPDTVKWIDNSAFTGCTGLKSIVLPNSLETIGTNAFALSGIASVNIPETVTTIEFQAFFRTNLTSVTIPGSVKKIGGYAFRHCDNLQTVNIKAGVEEIGDFCFNGCDSLSSVSIPNSVKYIGLESFSYCGKLESVVIPEGVSKISECAFRFTGLTSITLPGSVKNIESLAFSGCSSLTSVVVSDGTTSISAMAFNPCENLKTVVLPFSIQTIGGGAFGNKNRLADVWYEGTEAQRKAIGIDTGDNQTLLNATWHYNATEVLDSFVTRLYEVCLNRNPDAGGKKNWINNFMTGKATSIQVVKGFVFSQEFKNKNYCNDDYVKQLYRAFMGREADASGLASWVKKLNSGVTREEVFNGFALSKEFKNLCNTYGIKVGSAISIPKYGTIPTGCCSACGAEDGVTAFVKRLYRVCLDREADAGGLANWCKQLWNHTSSGRKVAYGFIFSKEFVNKNYSNEVYVEYLYQAFMGRASDVKGKENWVNLLNKGWSRKQVFDGFAFSKEFTNICNQYGILRD